MSSKETTVVNKISMFDLTLTAIIAVAIIIGLWVIISAQWTYGLTLGLILTGFVCAVCAYQEDGGKKNELNMNAYFKGMFAWSWNKIKWGFNVVKGRLTTEEEYDEYIKEAD